VHLESTKILFNNKKVKFIKIQHNAPLEVVDMGEMTPKERVLAALKREEVDRLPATSVTQTGTVEFMEKAGAFWPEAHKHVDQMVALAMAPYKEAGLECVRVPFCLTVEAEALGVSIHWGTVDRQPSARETPYKDAGEIKWDGFLEKNRVPVVIESVKRLKEEVGDELPVIAGFTGPVTLAGHLMDTERLIMESLTNPKNVTDFIDVAKEVLLEYTTALADAGADVLVSLDPTASTDILMPTSFDSIALPALKELHESIKSNGAAVVLHICGNVEPILSSMVETKADGLSIEHKVDMAKAREIVADKVALVGNISPVDHLLNGTPEVVEKATIEAIEKGADVIAPGCGIAPRTPIANIKAMVEAVKKYFA